LIDFGTKSEVGKDEICYLMDEPEFKLAPYAVESTLANVIPPNGQRNFSDETNRRFSELLATDSLIAKVRGSVDTVCYLLDAFFNRSIYNNILYISACFSLGG
jgi:hypothetical protein